MELYLDSSGEVGKDRLRRKGAQLLSFLWEFQNFHMECLISMPGSFLTLKRTPGPQVPFSKAMNNCRECVLKGSGPTVPSTALSPSRDTRFSASSEFPSTCSLRPWKRVFLVIVLSVLPWWLSTLILVFVFWPVFWTWWFVPVLGGSSLFVLIFFGWSSALCIIQLQDTKISFRSV